jgi:dihydropteroate synthase
MINCGGSLLDLSRPAVMGILNVTPDSFFDGGVIDSEKALLTQAEKHLNEGAVILDIGAVSTRPNAADVSLAEELSRLLPAVAAVRKEFTKAIISVDTFRAETAKQAINAGADIINDIGGGTLDEAMFEVIASLQVPYILMHIQGTPETMQKEPNYQNPVTDIFNLLLSKVNQLKALGVKDLIIDPGFGFGKTKEHNYSLLRELNQFKQIGFPLLAGVSRKRMINEVIQTKPSDALNGTSVLHAFALQNGANILRVHDVKEAVQCVRLFEATYPPILD